MNYADMKKGDVIASVEKLLTTVTGVTMMRDELDTYDIDLEREWYDTLDESFYEEQRYPWLMLKCWYGWTFGNVNNTIKFMKIAAQEPKSILDFGGGIGLASVQFAYAFPKSQIIYQNLPSPQVDLAKEIFKQFDVSDRITIDTSGSIPTAELVTAFEVFEHIKEPLKILREVLSGAKFYSDASSFSITSAGHHPVYVCDTVEVPQNRMKRLFNEELKRLNFKPSQKVYPHIKSFWNNRPSVWVYEK